MIIISIILVLVLAIGVGLLGRAKCISDRASGDSEMGRVLGLMIIGGALVFVGGVGELVLILAKALP